MLSYTIIVAIILVLEYILSSCTFIIRKSLKQTKRLDFPVKFFILKITLKSKLPDGDECLM